MDNLDEIDLDAVNTVKELASLLQQLRLLRIDRMSYEKMAKSIGNEISRSEMSRIFTGTDFPSRAQLRLILGILEIPAEGREVWDAMWDRLAQDLYRSDGWQRKSLDLPTRISGQDEQKITEVRQEVGSSNRFDDDSETRRAAAIIENAYDEADRIVKSARATAEIERETLIRDARAAASNLIDKALVEFAQIIQNSQVRIAGIVSDAEEKLQTVIVALNDSAENNHRASDELRQLVDDARASMGEIRSELAQVRAETDNIKEGYGVDPEAEQHSAGANEGKRKRLRLLSSRLFSDDRKVPPPVIGEPPDSEEDGHDDHAPPWLQDT